MMVLRPARAATPAQGRSYTPDAVNAPIEGGKNTTFVLRADNPPTAHPDAGEACLSASAIRTRSATDAAPIFSITRPR